MIHTFSVIIAIISLMAFQELVRPLDDDNFTGIYYLLKVDGTTISGTVTHDGEIYEIRSGVFFISDDDTCFSKTRFTAPGGEEMTREVRANYLVRDSQLIMTWE